jgi:hypothetical protein
MYIDSSGERITIGVGDVDTEVVMPHFQPDAVLGHARLGVPLPLAPVTSICHLDAMPMALNGGVPVPLPARERPDVLIGALVAAQYPGPDRRRQGDAVSAAIRLDRVADRI